MPNFSKQQFQNTEKVRLAVEIARIEVTLSAQEKEEVAKNLGISTETIRRYGNGEVAKIATAERMLAEMIRVKAQRDELAAL